MLEGGAPHSCSVCRVVMRSEQGVLVASNEARVRSHSCLFGPGQMAPAPRQLASAGRPSHPEQPNAPLPLWLLPFPHNRMTCLPLPPSAPRLALGPAPPIRASSPHPPLVPVAVPPQAVGPVPLTSMLLSAGLHTVFDAGINVDPNHPADPALQAENNAAAVQVGGRLAPLGSARLGSAPPLPTAMLRMLLHCRRHRPCCCAPQTMRRSPSSAASCTPRWACCASAGWPTSCRGRSPAGT